MYSFAIPDDTLDEFNYFLSLQGTILRLYNKENIIHIKLVNDMYLPSNNQIVNPNRQFYEVLENFFTNKGIKITYNNTRSCFWRI
ncbi:hypothetical protein [Oceanobacillus kimchii]|uniref:Uncharacterized protein n=1 Tax=Oceanobacillus kimchii TaxID=746691 RepID=A0ABQ5TH20_9BACI|nr:hypothetical protein [Oceanobacillus kimchii]GLO66174.1 hypothetical protein MACH08_19580 [Oceanobacillus kimchii]